MGGDGEIVITGTPAAATAVVAKQADSDDQLIDLWVAGMSRHTQRAYLKDVADFRRHARVPLPLVTLGHLQGFAEALEAGGAAAGLRRRKLAAIKSLISFGHRLGYLTYDVARPLRVPAVRETVAERILEEGEVHRLLGAERNPRNRVMLELLYASGIRVSELTALRWRDTQPRAEAGQIVVFGKGGKTRVIMLPARTWAALTVIRGNAGDERPVFPSRRGGHLDPSQVLRIVRAAARRAGIEKAVSPHWLRHCHCSHALDRGAPLHLVQNTCGHSSVAVTSTYLHARPSTSSGTYLGL